MPDDPDRVVPVTGIAYEEIKYKCKKNDSDYLEHDTIWGSDSGQLSVVLVAVTGSHASHH